jgi:hypothetical protein
LLVAQPASVIDYPVRGTARRRAHCRDGPIRRKGQPQALLNASPLSDCVVC